MTTALGSFGPGATEGHDKFDRGSAAADDWGATDLGAGSAIHVWTEDEPDEPAGTRRVIAWDPRPDNLDWPGAVARVAAALVPGGHLLLRADGRAGNAAPLVRALRESGFSYLRHAAGGAVLRRDRVNILYLAPWVSVGGSDKGTVDWFRHIDGDRFRPYLVTTQASDNTLLPLIGDHADEIWNLPDLLPGAAMPDFILDFIAARQVQVVHVMNSRLGFDLLPAIKRWHPHVRVVIQLHVEEEDRSGYCRYVCTRYDNLVDRYSVTSATLGRALGDYGVSPSKISVIYTGVDHAGEFDPDSEEAVAAAGARERPFEVLFPGRLTEQKDPFLMVRVVRAMHDAGSQVLAHVVGDGELRPAVEGAVRAAGLADHVRFHGVAHGMAGWYARTDVTLLTSRFEGLPFVVFEAMAMRHPVVATDTGGTHEVLDADSGFLVGDRADVSAIAGPLLRLEADPGLRRRMGEAGRKRVVADLGVDGMAAAHASLYQGLVDRHLDEALTRRLPACPA